MNHIFLIQSHSPVPYSSFSGSLYSCSWLTDKHIVLEAFLRSVFLINLQGSHRHSASRTNGEIPTCLLHTLFFFMWQRRFKSNRNQKIDSLLSWCILQTLKEFFIYNNFFSNTLRFSVFDDFLFVAQDFAKNKLRLCPCNAIWETLQVIALNNHD